MLSGRKINKDLERKECRINGYSQVLSFYFIFSHFQSIYLMLNWLSTENI